MIKQKSLKTLLSLLLTGLFLGANVAVAGADGAETGRYKYGPVNGYAYNNNAEINNDESFITYGSIHAIAAKDKAPTGFMGAKARLYAVSGSLIGETAWRYNDVPQKCVGNRTDSFKLDGYYCASGFTTAYNGHGYNIYKTPITFAIYCHSSESSKLSSSQPYHSPEISTVFPTNQNGQTYGSSAESSSPETEPYLVKAIGLKGKEGYVLSKDLNGNMPKNPGEAIAMMKAFPSEGKLIPLYDIDGKTVIDSFRITKGLNPSPVYPTNASGQTYGSSSDADIPEAEPDLVMAIGLDGTAGYVLNKDLNGDMPKSPQEALAMEKAFPVEGIIIALYAVDGKTVIGSFRICSGKKIENITNLPESKASEKSIQSPESLVNNESNKLSESQSVQSPKNSSAFPSNDNGQTYGSAGDVDSVEDEPDLIAALGVDGTSGYVLKKDLEGDMPRNPEEALAMMYAFPAEGKMIPLYAADGITVIGQFHISNGIANSMQKNSNN